MTPEQVADYLSVDRLNPAYANAVRDLIAERNALLKAFREGWRVEQEMLFDEEAVEGWLWRGPDGEDLVTVGAWDELPVLPDEWIKP